MNVDELQKSGKIIYEVVAGSIAYATNIESSDEDLRGIYLNDPSEYLGLSEPANQIGDEKHDVTYFSLKRFFELAKTANPNIIELLWMPEDVVRIQTPVMDKLLENRKLFISKKAFHTHSAYAFAQIKKAKGQNKMVNHPASEERPKKEDFVWIITYFDGYQAGGIFPTRPKLLVDTGINLNDYHVAGLEHVPNVYRMYYYGDEAKGVFRGDEMLVPESIPIGDEFSKFYGLMIYNKEAYEKAVRDWKKYWDWMRNKNPNRWTDQEKGKRDFDVKNMMHCMRLMLSSKSILETGEPIVRFEGKQLEKLMAIRRGELEYEDIMAEVEALEIETKRLYEESDVIPYKVDMKAIDALYREVSGS